MCSNKSASLDVNAAAVRRFTLCPIRRPHAIFCVRALAQRELVHGDHIATEALAENSARRARLEISNDLGRMAEERNLDTSS